MLAGVRRAGCALISTLAVVVVAAPPALAAPKPEGKAVAVQSLAGVAQRIKYRIGPFNVTPGQNSIGYAPILERPKVDGYITRIRPDLTYLDGRVPGVDIIHLHHAVWVNTSRVGAAGGFPAERFFAPGEEKTILRCRRAMATGTRRRPLAAQPHDPQPHAAADEAVHQLHDRLHPGYLARGQGHRAGAADLDGRRERQLYPVFDVRRGSGKDGTLHLPR